MDPAQWQYNQQLYGRLAQGAPSLPANTRFDLPLLDQSSLVASGLGALSPPMPAHSTLSPPRFAGLAPMNYGHSLHAPMTQFMDPMNTLGPGFTSPAAYKSLGQSFGAETSRYGTQPVVSKSPLFADSRGKDVLSTTGSLSAYTSSSSPPDLTKNWGLSGYPASASNPLAGMPDLFSPSAYSLPPVDQQPPPAHSGSNPTTRPSTIQRNPYQTKEFSPPGATPPTSAHSAYTLSSYEREIIRSQGRFTPHEEAELARRLMQESAGYQEPPHNVTNPNYHEPVRSSAHAYTEPARTVSSQSYRDPARDAPPRTINSQSYQESSRTLTTPNYQSSSRVSNEMDSYRKAHDSYKNPSSAQSHTYNKTPPSHSSSGANTCSKNTGNSYKSKSVSNMNSYKSNVDTYHKSSNMDNFTKSSNMNTYNKSTPQQSYSKTPISNSYRVPSLDMYKTPELSHSDFPKNAHGMSAPVFSDVSPPMSAHQRYSASPQLSAANPALASQLASTDANVFRSYMGQSQSFNTTSTTTATPTYTTTSLMDSSIDYDPVSPATPIPDSQSTEQTFDGSVSLQDLENMTRQEKLLAESHANLHSVPQSHGSTHLTDTAGHQSHVPHPGSHLPPGMTDISPGHNTKQQSPMQPSPMQPSPINTGSPQVSMSMGSPQVPMSMGSPQVPMSMGSPQAPIASSTVPPPRPPVQAMADSTTKPPRKRQRRKKTDKMMPLTPQDTMNSQYAVSKVENTQFKMDELPFKMEAPAYNIPGYEMQGNFDQRNFNKPGMMTEPMSPYSVPGQVVPGNLPPAYDNNQSPMTSISQYNSPLSQTMDSPLGNYSANTPTTATADYRQLNMGTVINTGAVSQLSPAEQVQISVNSMVAGYQPSLDMMPKEEALAEQYSAMPNLVPKNEPLASEFIPQQQQQQQQQPQLEPQLEPQPPPPPQQEPAAVNFGAELCATDTISGMGYDVDVSIKPRTKAEQKQMPVYMPSEIDDEFAHLVNPPPDVPVVNTDTIVPPTTPVTAEPPAQPQPGSSGSFLGSFLSFIQGEKSETLSSVTNCNMSRKPQLPKYVPDHRPCAASKDKGDDMWENQLGKTEPWESQSRRLGETWESQSESSTGTNQSSIFDKKTGESEGESGLDDNNITKTVYNVISNLEGYKDMMAAKSATGPSKIKKVETVIETSQGRGRGRGSVRGTGRGRGKKKGVEYGVAYTDFADDALGVEPAAPVVHDLPPPVKRETSKRQAKDKGKEKLKKKKKRGSDSDEFVGLSSGSENDARGYDSDNDPAWMPFAQATDFTTAAAKPAYSSGSEDEIGGKKKNRLKKIRNSLSKSGRGRGGKSRNRQLSGDYDMDSDSQDSSTDRAVLGKFVIDKKDLTNPGKYPIWKIDAGKLLQKYEMIEKDGQAYHRPLNTYSSWAESVRTNFRPINVSVVSNVRGVELVEIAAEDRPRPIRPVIRPPAQPAVMSAPPTSSASKSTPQAATSPTKHKPDVSSKKPSAAAAPSPKDAAPAEKRGSDAEEEEDEDPLTHPFNVYMQILISQTLEPGFLGAIREEGDQYYIGPLNEIDSLLSAKKSLILKAAQWTDHFQVAVDKCPYLTVTDRPNLKDHCQATGDSTQVALKSVQLFGEPYNRITLQTIGTSGNKPLEFAIGRHAALFLNTYHALHHYKFVLYKRCLTKVAALRSADENIDSRDILDQCLQNRMWVKKLLQEMQQLTSKAEQLPATAISQL